MNTNTMISAGRIATSASAWAASPAVMALTESEWGVLAGLHFSGDDVLLADLSPRVVAAYLSDPDVTRPQRSAMHSIRYAPSDPAMTRCSRSDPTLWRADKVDRPASSATASKPRAQAMPRLMLCVTRCTDPAAWYASKVGELVKFVCAGVGCWMARDEVGTLQRIDLEDADLVDVRGGVVSSIVS